jgi:hypothetical protein
LRRDDQPASQAAGREGEGDLRQFAFHGAASSFDADVTATLLSREDPKRHRCGRQGPLRITQLSHPGFENPFAERNLLLLIL